MKKELPEGRTDVDRQFQRTANTTKQAHMAKSGAPVQLTCTFSIKTFKLLYKKLMTVCYDENYYCSIILLKKIRKKCSRQVKYKQLIEKKSM